MHAITAQPQVYLCWTDANIPPELTLVLNTIETFASSHIKFANSYANPYKLYINDPDISGSLPDSNLGQPGYGFQNFFNYSWVNHSFLFRVKSGVDKMIP